MKLSCGKSFDESLLSCLCLDVKRVKTNSKDCVDFQGLFNSMEAGEETWYIRMIPSSCGYGVVFKKDPSGKDAAVVESLSSLSAELSVLFDGMLSKEPWAPSLDVLICSAMTEEPLVTSLSPLFHAGVLTGAWSADQAVSMAVRQIAAMEDEVEKALSRKNPEERETTTLLRTLVKDLKRFVRNVQEQYGVE